ncbi:MAG: LysM peptidoglycan-binding domain-containing protein, partial [Candidatus Binatia bacterium]
VERTAASGAAPGTALRDFPWAMVVFVLVAAAGSLALWVGRDDARVRRVIDGARSHLSSLFGVEAVAHVTPPVAAMEPAAAPAASTPRQEASHPSASTSLAEPPSTVLVADVLAPEPAPVTQPSPNADEPKSAWIDHEVKRGTTAWEIAAAAYGSWCHLGLDLIAEMNPEIADLDELLPGQKLRLPAFSSRTLTRRSSGVGLVILGSFASSASAQAFASQAARRSRHEVRVRAHRSSGKIVLHRVEILVPEAEMPAAWQTAASLDLLPPRFEAFDAGSKRNPSDVRNRCATSVVASRD